MKYSQTTIEYYNVRTSSAPEDLQMYTFGFLIFSHIKSALQICRFYNPQIQPTTDSKYLVQIQPTA